MILTLTLSNAKGKGKDLLDSRIGSRDCVHHHANRDPTPNSRNPGHVHFEVIASGHRIYEIVFAGDPFIPDSFHEQARLPNGGVLIVERRTVRGGLVEEHDVRVQ